MAKNSSRICGSWLVVLLSFMAFVKGHALHATDHMIPSEDIFVGRMGVMGVVLGASVGLAFCENGLGASTGACLGGAIGLAVGKGIVCLRLIKNKIRAAMGPWVVVSVVYEGPLERAQMQESREAADTCAKCRVRVGRSHSI